MMPLLPPYSLRMEFVERPIHAHGYIQVVEASVLSDLFHHGGHAGTTQLSRPLGHHPTHHLDQDTVVTRAVQTQLLKDSPHLEQC